MDARDDALVAAAEEVLRIRDVARGIDGAVATVGRLEVEPGGVNVIPGRVRLTIDARAPDDERLGRLLDGLGIDPAGCHADRRRSEGHPRTRSGPRSPSAGYPSSSRARAPGTMRACSRVPGCRRRCCSCVR